MGQMQLRSRQASLQGRATARALTWQPPFEIPPLVIDLDAYFAEVWEEDLGVDA